MGVEVVAVLPVAASWSSRHHYPKSTEDTPPHSGVGFGDFCLGLAAWSVIGFGFWSSWVVASTGVEKCNDKGTTAIDFT